MFNRDNPSNTPPPDVPEVPPQIVLPAIRTFRVLRQKPGAQGLEVVTVLAHKIALADDNRTIFQVYRINPPIGVELLVDRIMVDVQELEEIITPETSPLLM